MIGILSAIAAEACHWTRVRWDFDDDACGKAWQFTSIAIALAAVLIWLDGNRYTALPGLLSWLPPLLLPMQFVQSYGMRRTLPLSVFSLFARHRRERNRRLGLTEETPEFNFGNVLFIAVMVAATVGTGASSWLFLPGVVVLTGWLLLGRTASPPLTLIPLLVLSGLLARAGQIGLGRASTWFAELASGGGNSFNPNWKSTMIGVRGTVVQSPDIEWRLTPRARTAPPALLRTATYNSLYDTNWQNQRVASVDFKDLDSRIIGTEPYYLLQPAERTGNLPELPSFTLRGAATAESPLPLAGDAAGLRDFELDGIERNSLGTVRVYPKHSVVNGTVFWKGGTNPEGPPVPEEDLRIPFAERVADTTQSPGPQNEGAVHQAVRDLRLQDQPTLQGKLGRLLTWFHRDFRYTRELTIRSPRKEQRLEAARNKEDARQFKTPITRFLTDVRAGHCEYFATAAVLMLRDAGIPARYAVGYAVMERDARRGEWLLRGTHGHAWCRVWDESKGMWIDFDPTPPDWFATVPPPRSQWLQRFNDGLKRMREDFFLWRNQPSHQTGVSIAMIGIGLALGGFIVRRLWRSRQRLHPGTAHGSYEGPIVRTPLHDLEPLAIKRLGQRPAGKPFAEWLRLLRPALTDTAPLDEAISLHQQARFDPEPAGAEDRERLAKLAAQLAVTLKNHPPAR